MRRRSRLVLSLALVVVSAVPARAEGRYQAQIAAAATRFGLDPRLIEAVIRAESGGDPRAVSRAGAMGLMQLMPRTWAELRDRLALGPDPFSPGDNILAGAAYLRALHDRYGAPGFLAAYNAGPARYEASLAGRSLPPETQAYVGRLTSGLATLAPAADWRSAGLFSSAWPASLGPATPAWPPGPGDVR